MWLDHGVYLLTVGIDLLPMMPSHGSQLRSLLLTAWHSLPEALRVLACTRKPACLPAMHLSSRAVKQLGQRAASATAAWHRNS